MAETIKSCCVYYIYISRSFSSTMDGTGERSRRGRRQLCRQHLNRKSFGIDDTFLRWQSAWHSGSDAINQIESRCCLAIEKERVQFIKGTLSLPFVSSCLAWKVPSICLGSRLAPVHLGGTGSSCLMTTQMTRF